MYLAERTKSYFKENTWKAWLMMSHFQNNLRNVRALCTSIVCKPAPIIHSRYSTMVKINIKKMEGLSLTDECDNFTKHYSAQKDTHFSISFLALGLSRSILVMMLTWGISRDTMALSAAITPEMNCTQEKQGTVDHWNSVWCFTTLCRLGRLTRFL